MSPLSIALTVKQCQLPARNKFSNDLLTFQSKSWEYLTSGSEFLSLLRYLNTKELWLGLQLQTCAGCWTRMFEERKYFDEHCNVWGGSWTKNETIFYLLASSSALSLHCVWWNLYMFYKRKKSLRSCVICFASWCHYLLSFYHELCFHLFFTLHPATLAFCLFNNSVRSISWILSHYYWKSNDNFRVKSLNWSQIERNNILVHISEYCDVAFDLI